MTSTRLIYMTSCSLLAAALISNSAAACPGEPSEPCAQVDYWDWLAPTNAAKIPADGALVLQGVHSRFDDSPWLAQIDIEVRKDGEPVAGALEITTQPGVLLWRPTAGWTAGATYQMTGALHNPVSEFEQCGPPTIDLAAELVVDSEPAAALAEPVATGELEVIGNPQVSLADLACCPGVAPMEIQQCVTQVNWDPTTCAPTVVYRFMKMTFTAAPVVGPTAAQIGYTFKVDGQILGKSMTPSFTYGSDVPVCAVIEAEDLVTGEIKASAEQCFGQDIAATLGTQPLDPTATLSCELQQCAVVGDTWDLDMCTPFTPAPADDTDGDTDDSDETAGLGEGKGKGCSVHTGSTDLVGALGLLALLGLRRRRSAA